MSLILDALARAERDKRRDADGVSDLLVDRAGPAAAPPRWPWIALSLALLVCLALVLLWRWPAAAPAPPDSAVRAGKPVVASVGAAPGDGAAPAISDRVATAPVAGAADRGGPVAPAPAAIAAGDRDAVAALYGETTAASPASGDGDAAAALVPETPASLPPRGLQGEAVAAAASVDRAAQPREVTAAAPDPQSADAPIDVEQVLRAVRAEAAASALEPHPVPLLADLSKQFRDSVPTLMYLRHDYRSDGLSTIEVNGEALRVGQRTRNVEVREILPDSTIFRFGATDFRLRALNSWVNL